MGHWRAERRVLGCQMEDCVRALASLSDAAGDDAENKRDEWTRDGTLAFL